MATNLVCPIPGCGKRVVAKGWCQSHYDRWHRYGDPLHIPANAGPLRYFKETVLIYDGDDCLFWPYSGNGKGYGKITFEGKRQYVHRIVCERTNGPQPSPRHEAAHSCGNGHLGCVNAKHLSWKTHTGNESDKRVHGTTPRGERQWNSKLTESDVREIRRLTGSDTQENIAKKFGVSRHTISLIMRGMRWSWLDAPS